MTLKFKLNLFLFQACPFINDTSEIYCGKKLNKQRHCGSCDKIVNTPQVKLYTSIWIQDLQHPKIQKALVAFHYAAEAFLGMSIHSPNSRNEARRIL